MSSSASVRSVLFDGITPSEQALLDQIEIEERDGTIFIKCPNLFIQQHVKRTYTDRIKKAFGGHVVRAKQIMHGKTSAVTHLGSDVFKGIPSPFTVIRYHSLAIERSSIPDCLLVTAQTDDGEIMGVRHRTLPVYGVQFHPESILSEHGHALLKNFLELNQDMKECR